MSGCNSDSNMTGGVLSSQIYLAYSRIQTIRQAAASGRVDAASAALAAGITDQQLARPSTAERRPSLRTDVSRIMNTLSTTIQDYDISERHSREEAAAAAAAPRPPTPPPAPAHEVTFSLASMADVEAAANAELAELAERAERESETPLADVLAPAPGPGSGSGSGSEQPSADLTPDSTRVSSTRLVTEMQRRAALMWGQTARVVEQLRLKHAASDARRKAAEDALDAARGEWNAERDQIMLDLSQTAQELASAKRRLADRPVVYAGSQPPPAPVEVTRTETITETIVNEVVEPRIEPVLPLLSLPSITSSSSMGALPSLRDGVDPAVAAVGSLDVEFSSPRRRRPRPSVFSMEWAQSSAQASVQSSTSISALPSSSPSPTSSPSPSPRQPAQPAQITNPSKITRTIERVVVSSSASHEMRSQAQVQTSQPESKGIFVQTEDTTISGQQRSKRVAGNWVELLASSIRLADSIIEGNVSSEVLLKGATIDSKHIFTTSPSSDVPQSLYGPPASAAPAPAPAPSAAGPAGPAGPATLAAAADGAAALVSTPLASIVSHVDATVAAAAAAPATPFGPITRAAAGAAVRLGRENARNKLERDVRAAAGALVSVSEKPADDESSTTTTTQEHESAELRLVHTMRTANTALQSQLDTIYTIIGTFLTPNNLHALTTGAAGASEFKAGIEELRALATAPAARRGVCADVGVQARAPVPALSTDAELAAVAGEALLGDVSGGHAHAVLRARLIGALRGVDAATIGDGAQTLPALSAEMRAAAGSSVEAGLLQALAAVEMEMSGGPVAGDDILNRLTNEMNLRARTLTSTPTSLSPRGGHSPRTQFPARGLSSPMSPRMTPVLQQQPSPVRKMRLAPPRGRPTTPGIQRVPALNTGANATQNTSSPNLRLSLPSLSLK